MFFSALKVYTTGIQIKAFQMFNVEIRTPRFNLQTTQIDFVVRQQLSLCFLDKGSCSLYTTPRTGSQAQFAHVTSAVQGAAFGREHICSTSLTLSDCVHLPLLLCPRQVYVLLEPVSQREIPWSKLGKVFDHSKHSVVNHLCPVVIFMDICTGIHCAAYL